MIRDLQYPDDARRVVDSLHAGLRYDSTVSLLGPVCRDHKLLGDGPDFTVRFRCGDRAEDDSVRRDAVVLLSRYSLILMISRFERHMGLLLLQKRVIEHLGATEKKMDPASMWMILKSVAQEVRRGPVTLCSKLLIKNPTPELQSRMSWLTGVYRVRNCLAHRLGVVQIEDVKPYGKTLSETKDEDRLRAIWLRPKVTDEGKEVTLPHHTTSGNVQFSFEESAREWKIGDTIEVEPLDCQCIALSLSLLANQVLAEFEAEINASLGLRPIGKKETP